MKFTAPVFIKKPPKIATKKAMEQVIKELIKKDPVVVFSKSDCEYSSLAKDILWRMNKPYTTIELDHRRDGNEMLTALGRMTGAATVPRIFVKGRFLGGASDLEKLYYSGKLFEILK